MCLVPGMFGLAADRALSELPFERTAEVTGWYATFSGESLGCHVNSRRWPAGGAVGFFPVFPCNRVEGWSNALSAGPMGDWSGPPDRAGWGTCITGQFVFRCSDFACLVWSGAEVRLEFVPFMARRVFRYHYDENNALTGKNDGLWDSCRGSGNRTEAGDPTCHVGWNRNRFHSVMVRVGIGWNLYWSPSVDVVCFGDVLRLQVAVVYTPCHCRCWTRVSPWL